MKVVIQKIFNYIMTHLKQNKKLKNVQIQTHKRRHATNI